MADGSFWDAIQAPSWLRSMFGVGSNLGDMTGAAQDVASGTPSQTEMASWAMNPALSGVPDTSQSLAATTSIGGAGSGQQAGGNALAGALKNLAGPQQQNTQNQNYAKPPDTQMGLRFNQAQIGRPSAPASMNSLAQLLLQRQQGLMQPGQSGGTSAPYSGQRQLGLLGF